MKLVVAIIQPTKLQVVQEALRKLEVHRMTVFDAQGYARQKGQTVVYRGAEYTSGLLRKVVLEIVVNDDFLERTLEAIQRFGRTGSEGAIGDGKLFVMPVDEVIDIGGGHRGPGAV